jgi:hypothetical protein
VDFRDPANPDRYIGVVNNVSRRKILLVENLDKLQAFDCVVLVAQPTGHQLGDELASIGLT